VCFKGFTIGVQRGASERRRAAIRHVPFELVDACRVPIAKWCGGGGEGHPGNFKGYICHCSFVGKQELNTFAQPSETGVQHATRVHAHAHKHARARGVFWPRRSSKGSARRRRHRRRTRLDLKIERALHHAVWQKGLELVAQLLAQQNVVTRACARKLEDWVTAVLMQ